MQVGRNDAVELKELSQSMGLDFSQLLLEYSVESLLYDVFSSEYSDNVCLIYGLPEDFRSEKKREDKIELYYKKGRKGYELTVEILEAILDKVLDKDKNIDWMYKIREDKGAFVMEMSGSYRNMRIPVTARIKTLEDITATMEEGNLERIMPGDKPFKYQYYSPESKLVPDIYEIFYKLELISSIEPYYRVAKVLKSTPLSGRHIVEKMSQLTKDREKVFKARRIEQIKGYRDYSYMRKRWNAYCKAIGDKDSVWEEELDLIVSFAEPIWNALCKNEVFFDDWMPELRRFLG